MTQLFMRRKITRKIFRLPMTTEQAFDMILAAYKAEVLRRGREFSFDANAKTNVMRLAGFLTRNSAKFGFMLIGNCGNGKTTLLYAIQNMLNWLVSQDYLEKDSGIRIVDAKEVAAISKDYKQSVSLKNTPMLAIEDIGRESTEVLDYGNAYSPVIDLLEYRYTNQLFTAFTSNLSVDELTEKYGKRIADRFREMFEKIVFLNKSYR